jgi:hypothetical protein
MNRRLLLAVAIPITLAQTSAKLDQQLAEMRARSIVESNAYRESGGKPGGPGDPALKWANDFWKFREEHPGTPAATRATGLSLSWLRHADQDNEVLARAEKLPVDDPVWVTFISGARESARKTGQHDRFLRIAESVLSKAKTADLRVAVNAAIGRSWLDRNKPEQARGALEAAVREGLSTTAAKAAQKDLDGISRLNPGGLAPRFAAKTIEGIPIALEDFRGKVVFLNFWASW